MKLQAGDYYTVEEMAALEKVRPKTIYQRAFRAGLKPVSPNALWDQDAYEIIRNASGKGRPRKSSPKKAKSNKPKKPLE